MNDKLGDIKWKLCKKVTRQLKVMLWTFILDDYKTEISEAIIFLFLVFLALPESIFKLASVNEVCIFYLCVPYAHFQFV